jgi:hypothetical protein
MGKPIVTEHAIFRYLERTGRIDPAAIAAEMLSPRVVDAIKVGARSVRDNGVTFILEAGRVVTVVIGKPSNRALALKLKAA